MLPLRTRFYTIEMLSSLALALVLLLNACVQNEPSSQTPSESGDLSPTLSMSQTVEINPTASLTPLPTAQIVLSTPTITIEPPPTPGAGSDLRIIAAIVTSDNNIVFVGPGGERVKSFKLEANLVPLSTMWSDNGCELQVVARGNNEIRLIGLNLYNDDLTEYFVGSQDESGRWKTWPALSPNREWISYVVWSGEFYLADAEYQNVEVLPLDGLSAPFALTQHGGAWTRGGEWSPDSSYLAYGDFDSSGISQIYYSRPDGTDRHQITQFSDPQYHTGPLRWSPSGQFLAILMYKDFKGEHESTELWIASIDGFQIQKTIGGEAQIVVADNFWWSSDEEALLVNTVDIVSRVNSLKWIFPENGTLIKNVDDDNVPGGSIDFPFPIQATQLIGFVAGDGELYQYDFRDNTFSPWAKLTSLLQNRNADLLDISAFDGSLINVDTCGP